jgi:CRP-like cAMP-binding protein
VTVRAREPVRALRISAQVFLRLLSESPEVALDMMRQLCERLASTTKRLESAQRQLVDARIDQPAKGA